MIPIYCKLINDEKYKLYYCCSINVNVSFQLVKSWCQNSLFVLLPFSFVAFNSYASSKSVETYVIIAEICINCETCYNAEP